MINWADAAIDNSSEKYKPLAKRAVALSIARAIDTDTYIPSATARARAIDSAIVIDSTSNIAKAIDSAINRARDRARGIVRGINLPGAIDIASAINITSDKKITIDWNGDNDGVMAIASTIASVKTLIRNQFFTLRKFDKLPAQLSQLIQSIPRGYDSEQWSQWTDQLEFSCLEALALDKDAITFSETEAKAFQDYLYANELLIRCKQSAVRVSRKAWEELEARLLKLR